MENKTINILILLLNQKNELNNIKLIDKIPIEALNLLINSSLLRQKLNSPFSSNCYDAKSTT